MLTNMVQIIEGQILMARAISHSNCSHLSRGLNCSKCMMEIQGRSKLSRADYSVFLLTLKIQRCVNCKKLLDEVFVISRIIEVDVGVISLG